MRVLKNISRAFTKPFTMTGDHVDRRIVLGAGLFVFIYIFLIFSVYPMGVEVEKGRPSPQTIYAPRDAIDQQATEELREEVAAEVEPVYDYNEEVVQQGQERILEFFDSVRRVRTAEDAPREDQVSILEEYAPEEFSENILLAFLEIGEDSFDELENRILSIYTETMEEGVKEEEEQLAQRTIFQEISLLPFNSEIKQGMEKLIAPLIEPNKIYNEEATAEKREAARQEVEPVRIMRNALIVQEGERVTEEHISQLEALGLLGPRVHLGGYVGLFFLVLIIFLLLTLYIYLFNKEIFDNVTYLSLLGLIFMLTLVLGLGAHYFSGYLIPLAMAAILITVLFEARLAVLVTAVLALVLGFIVDGELGYMLVATTGALIGIYSVAQLQNRSDLTKAGIFVAGINMLTVISYFLFTRGFYLEYEYLREFSVAALSGVGSGLFSAVMAIGLLPYLESAFGLTTAVTLLELSDPGRPLLKKLLMETPGTYHHSIMVGNLSEAAAESVGADPLLARVGAFYHDIGKIRRPYFFIENQFTGDNPHKRISSHLSALIIRAHVKDGVEMARKARLPQPVIDIIQQHHGTSLISYFYRQALGNSETKEKGLMLPSESEFRYKGPLPQTKEAAIILLADSVEAAVRSLSHPVAGRVEGMVRRVIKEKLDDGQFDEAPLTLKDLDKIGDTFVYILSGFFHTRIEYPEGELKADLAKEEW